MLAIKHILFPIDFSERTCGAAPFVEAMASQFGAKVTLMSVAPPLWNAGMGELAAPIILDTQAVTDDLQAQLGGVLVKEFAHLQVSRVAEMGDPANEIMRFAHSQAVDLIMMPTHGYGPFRRLLLGSVTAKVLHDAQCPVWTGAHIEEPPAREHMACRSVLCAVDETLKSASVIEWAAQFARDTGATLRLAHAVRIIAGWPERQFEWALQKEARANIERLQKQVGIEAPLCVAVGEVAEMVRDEAQRNHSDLIVIGRGVLNETLGRLRTHAYGIIRNAPCPVISV